MEMSTLSQGSLTQVGRKPACPAAILAVCVCVCVCVCVFSALTSFSIRPSLLIVSFPSSSLEGAGCQDQL